MHTHHRPRRVVTLIIAGLVGMLACTGDDGPPGATRTVGGAADPPATRASTVGGVTIRARLVEQTDERLRVALELDALEGDLRSERLDITGVLVDGREVDAEVVWLPAHESATERRGELVATLPAPARHAVGIELRHFGAVERRFEWPVHARRERTVSAAGP